MKRFFVIFLMLVVFNESSSGASKSTENRLFIPMPIDQAMKSNPSKNNWLRGFIDAQVRFRLEPLSGIDVVPEKRISKYFPEIFEINEPFDDTICKKAEIFFKAPYVLIQKFEFDNREEAIVYYTEILNTRDRSVIASAEKTCHLENVSNEIDTVLLSLLEQLKVNLTNVEKQGFRIPLLNKNFKMVKQVGKTIVEGHYLRSITPEKTIREFEDALNKDPNLLIGAYFLSDLYFQTKNYENSTKYCKQLIELIPVHHDFRLQLAIGYRALKQFPEALSILTTAPKTTDLSLNIAFAEEKASVFESLQELGAAANAHRQILAQDSLYEKSLIFLCRFHNALNQVDQSRKYVASLKGSRNPQALYEIGNYFLAINKQDSAITQFQKITIIDTSNYEAYVKLGEIYMLRKEFESAYANFNKGLLLSQKDLSILLQTSNSLKQLKRDLKAYELVNSYKAEHNKKFEFLKEIGELEFLLGLMDSSEAHILKALEFKPTDNSTKFLLAKVFSEKRKFENALSILNQTEKIQDYSKLSKLEISKIYIAQNKYSDALTLLNQLLAGQPLQKVNYYIGKSYFEIKNYHKSIAALNREIEIFGEDSLSLKLIGINQLVLENREEAKKIFDICIKKYPENSEFYYYATLIALQTNDTLQSKVYFSKGDSFGKPSDTLNLVLADEYIRLEQYENAISHYGNFIKNNPTHEYALMNIAAAYLQSGKDSSAAEVYIKLFNLQNVKHNSLLAQAGHIFNDLKKYDNAKSAYELFFNKGFIDFEVNVKYAKILYGEKNYTKVITLLENLNGTWASDNDVVIILADSYCQNKKFQTALPLLKKILAKDPSNPNALLLHSQASENTNDLQTAAISLRKYLSLEGVQSKDLSFHLGELYEKQKMYAEAISQYEKNIKDTPDDLRNHEHLGKIFVQQKKYTNAKDVLQLAVEYPQCKPELVKILARVLGNLGDVDNASENYKLYLSRNEKDSLVWKEYGKLLFKNDRFSHAIYPLSEASRRLVNDFGTFRMLGESYFVTKNFVKAIPPLTRACEINPVDQNTVELLTRSYRSLGENSSLESVLSGWVKTDPKRFDIQLELAVLYLVEKKYQNAITILEKASRFIPTDERPYMLLARCYEFTGEDSARYDNLKKAQKFGDDNSEIHFQTARYYIGKSEISKAEKHLLRAIDLDNNNGYAHYELGLIYVQKEDFSKALEEFYLAVDQSPNNALFKVLYAFSLAKNNYPEQALENSTVAVGKQPDNVMILYWAAKVNQILGKTDAARQLLLDAISIDSSYAPVYDALGDIYYEQASFTNSSKYLFQAWEKGGFQEKRALKLTRSLSMERKYYEAVPFIEAVVQRNSSNSEALYQLVKTQCALGQVKQAKETFNKLDAQKNLYWRHLAQAYIYETELNYTAAWISFTIAQKIQASSDVNAGFGRFYLNKKQYDSASIYLALAVDMDSTDLNNLCDLGRAYMGMNQYDLSLDCFNRIVNKQPRYGEVYELLAEIKFARREDNAAIALLLRGLHIFPDNPKLHFMLAEGYQKTEQYDFAINSFQDAFKKSKGMNIDALRRIGNIYYSNLVNTKKAKEFYAKYIKAGGKNQEVEIAMQQIGGKE